MEIISERDRILLGDAPRDPFTGVVLSSQRRSSEVDFHDVFGGPPRRSSIYKARGNRDDSVDLHCREKPVFDDGSGSDRRRQLGDDFYSDIFQSSDSACSSPMRGDRDASQSSPDSRFNSLDGWTPIRPEPLFGGPLLPQPRISKKMDKGLDHSACGSLTRHSVYRNEDDRSDSFGFPLSPNASSTGFFTTQSVVGHGDLSNNSYASNRPSLLSYQIPSISKGLSDAMKPDFQTVESQSETSSSSLEDYISNRQFHFSIYKWAGKGVMLVLPSDPNDRNEIEGRLTRLPEVIVQDLEPPSNSDYFSPLSKAFKSRTVTQKEKLENKDVDYIAPNAKGLLHAEPDSELLKDDANKMAGKCANLSEKSSILCFDKNFNTNCMNEKHNSEFKFNAHGEQDHELKCLSQLFDVDIDKRRSNDTPSQVKEREAQSKCQENQLSQRESRPVPDKANCTTLHATPFISGENARGNKVKGKVKEFIRKFSQEGSPKRKGAFEILVRRSKGNENRQNKVDELANVSSIGENKLLGKGGSTNIPLCDIPKAMENQALEKAEEGISCDGCFSEEKIEVLPTKSEPTPAVFDNTTCHEENILEDFEVFMVQQLPLNLTEAAQNSPQQDQIKNLDAKIRQWSRGKEGNIRSLLSTLQLVLWPESGWKQVPLVNIIEGPSVKKAYQKALLCLHPDKLQQKSASSNQKYIAEKVFAILQEAWDHFNSISEL